MGRERGRREEEGTSISKEAEEIRKIMTQACDAAMLRVRNNKRKGVA